MGKSEPSDEDIRDWIREGWKFTKRTRKGHVYITRRMGANIERSLGRFKQSLWERIEKISREPEEPQKETDLRSLFYILVSDVRAYHSSVDCLHIDDEGYCTYWRWEKELPLLRYGENIKMKEVVDEGNHVYLIEAHGNYCRGCTTYISKKMKSSKS